MRKALFVGGLIILLGFILTGIRQSPREGSLVQAAPAELDPVPFLKGKVSFKGDKATLKLDEATKILQAEMAKKDSDHCFLKDALKAETEQQTWRIADDGGLANVIVYLKPPRGTYFTVNLKKVKFDKEKILDQPHCAYVPHVFVLFPQYWDADGKKQSTGQQLFIRNSAKMNHNTSIEEFGFNQIINAGKQVTVEDVKAGTKPLMFKCTIHPFMTAYALALNHPYAAVTNAKGEFEIADVPADVPVEIVVWHEEGVCKDYEKGKGVTLKSGENKMNFTVEPR
jgi:hypothetical protein